MRKKNLRKNAEDLAQQRDINNMTMIKNFNLAPVVEPGTTCTYKLELIDGCMQSVRTVLVRNGKETDGKSDYELAQLRN